MEQSNNTIIDLKGNALSGVAVRVFAQDGSLAELFSDNGLTPVSNPVFTDPNGRYWFYAANGRYTTQIEAPDGAEYPGEDLVLFDPADSSLVSASDFPTLQAAADSGKVVTGAPGQVYPLTGQINIPSGGGFTDIEFSLSDDFFTATEKGVGAANIAIQALNVSGVVVNNVKIVADVGVNSFVYATAFRAVQGALIRDLDVSGLNAGACVLIDSCTDVVIDRPKLHDCLLDRNIPGGQMTGIVTDEFRIGGVGTNGLQILDANIKRLLWTPAFLAAYGPQTDGINIQAGTQNYVISNAIIDEVGEGIDTWGDNGVIITPNIDRALGYAIKFIHGATGNTVVTPKIRRSGLGGIVVAGSDSVTKNTDSNTILDPQITEAGYDPGNYWAQPTYGIGINNDGVTYKPTNTLVRRGRVTKSPNADGAYQSATSGANNVYEDCESDGTAVAEYIGGGAVIRKRGQFGTGSRSAAFDSSGVLTLRYDDNGATTMLQYGNYGITGTNQGASVAWQFGTGSTFTATAARMRVLTTDTWAAAANRSVKWSVDLIQGGALSPALEYDPTTGLKVGPAGALVNFPNGTTKLPAFTVATLPNAATYQWGLIAVTDGTANKRLAISDGTNWRWPDGAIVS